MSGKVDEIITILTILTLARVCISNTVQANSLRGFLTGGGCDHLQMSTRIRARMLINGQSCRLCAKAGHNARTCPSREKDFSNFATSLSNSRSDSSDSGYLARPVKALQKMRKCKCGSVEVTHGLVSARLDGTWQEFLCFPCGSQLQDAETLRMKCAVCRRHAYFGPFGGGRRDAIHCKQHRLDSEVNLLSKVCTYSGGCTVRPTFGDPAERALLFCNRHKRSTDVDLVHRRCEHPGCGTIPTFGDFEDGRARFCATHRLPGQFDVVNRRCRHPEGCDVQATYGSPVDGTAAFCAQHRGLQHVDVKSRRCAAVEGCARQPHFGMPGDRIPSYCACHRHRSHVELLNRRSPPAEGAQGRRGRDPPAKSLGADADAPARRAFACEPPLGLLGQEPAPCHGALFSPASGAFAVGLVP